MEVAAGREDEQRAAHGGVAFVLGERNSLSCEVGGDDEVDVRVYAAYSSATASASSRMEIPSSSSSRVMVSGGQTITTFQCVIR